jgi:hypothetical protein
VTQQLNLFLMDVSAEEEGTIIFKIKWYVLWKAHLPNISHIAS